MKSLYPDLERYRRQISIKKFGREGQEKLSNAKVAILGVGGLGSIVSLYLAAAGVGYLKLVDRDIIEKSNLNRQILYREDEIGEYKSLVAERKIENFNREIEVKGVIESIDENNISRIIDGVDAVVDCLDNFETRFIVNKEIIKRRVPLFHAACGGLSGQVTTIIPGETPCLRCIFPIGINSKNNSILGPVAGVVGSVEAMEAIKFFTGVGEMLTNKLLIFDAEKNIYEKIEIKKDPNCEVCGNENKD